MVIWSKKKLKQTNMTCSLRAQEAKIANESGDRAIQKRKKNRKNQHTQTLFRNRMLALKQKKNLKFNNPPHCAREIRFSFR